MNKKNMCQNVPVQNFSSEYSESYIKLSKHRSIFLTEVITTEVAADLSALLIYYDSINPNDEITIYIHTDGGDVLGLNNIYDVMQLISSPVKTVCIGKAYSAGAVLLSAGTPGHRFAFKNSNIMIHGIQTSFPHLGDDLSNSKILYEFLTSCNINLMKILSYHTKHPLDQIKKDCLEDKYMTAKEAKDYGIVDYIIG